MQYELTIGLRYTRAKKRGAGRNRFISFISMTSMLGIALGVAALIVVLSVMNGFQMEIRTRTLSVASHIEIFGAGNELANWRETIAAVRQHPQVVAAAPYVQQQGLLSSGSEVQGVMVRGIDPRAEEGVAEFEKHMHQGHLADLRPGEFGIVLGLDLARALRAAPGDKVTLIAPQGLVTPVAVLPRLKQFRVVGIFEIRMQPYDGSLALIDIRDAQTLYQMGDSVSGVRLKVADLFEAPRIAGELLRYLDMNTFITDWTRSNVNYFRAIAIEKIMMFLFLLLIVAVAAFNVVSTLVMAVTDKQADIAILRTLGASPQSIMLIFIVQGVLIGLVGLLLGVVGGVTLALNIDVVVPAIEHLLGIQFLSKDVYYISDLPSDLHWNDVALITGVSFLLTLLATLYPSWRASRVNPAEALRYE
ncbi:Lipoprotein-releasing system transmembrane protein LolC [Georgfuchsia toluolica]|uniref:Lipoprotein-releasing system transmembrane protein LolC n=1 Tax=Georgfuchsia toluolica TaxID=424218 RepID=A0A916MZR6_9PROT|nr:lipoprotein-releasing ABC transporter permease subunit [Georgfuchsia toluolica]CAG4883193.1 Lipoprotein-releasing system transmembrane protein LolC [Georgfuchsia toluolica]